jgi:hypothetical protein
MVVVSFDIDGTLEIGEPPRPVPPRLVALTKLWGCVVGSASDRTLDEQRQIWASAAIAVDFVNPKHLLREKKLGFGHGIAKVI